MPKSKLTTNLEDVLRDHINPREEFVAFEVTIGWGGNERVDAISANIQHEIRCYEIKTSKADFLSTAKKTFIGHYNYFVMPHELYEELKAEKLLGWQWDKIGILTIKKEKILDYIPLYKQERSSRFSFNKQLNCVKRAKKCRIEVNMDMLYINIMRSMDREIRKNLKNF